MSLRSLISLVESLETLEEMPQLQDEPEDFGMESDDYQDIEYHRLMLSDGTKIMNISGADLYILEGEGEGEVYLLDHREKKVLYTIQYDVNNYPGIGTFATQVVLWRSEDPRAKGLPQKVVFDVLIPKYGAVVSDKVQTIRGSVFWEKLMNMALVRGLTVGLIKEGEQIETYNKADGSFDDWLDNIEGWGYDIDTHYERLFFIKK